MKKRTKLHYLLVSLLMLVLISNGCSSAPSKETANVNREYKSVTLKEFFPSLSGNIADYSIQLPVGYESNPIPSQSTYGATLWAMPEDLKLFQDPEQYDVSLVTSTVFKAVWSTNVGVSNDQIVTAGIPVTKADFEKQGIKDVNFTSGLFHGFTGVPTLTMSGTMEGESAYLAYLYSPVDDTVILIVLGGNKTGTTDEQDWDAFVKSLEIK